MLLDFSLFQCHYTQRIYGISHLHRPRLVQSTYETITSCTHIALCSSLYCTTVWPFSFPCVCTNSDKYFVAGTGLEILIYMGPGLSGTLDQMTSRGPFQPKLCSDLCVCVCVNVLSMK